MDPRVRFAFVAAPTVMVLAILFHAVGRIYCDKCRRAFAVFYDVETRCDHLCRRCWRTGRDDKRRRMRVRS